MNISSFREHFEKLAVPMAISNPDAEMIEVNSAFCEYLGYSRAEMLSMSVFDYTHPDDIRSTKGLFDKVRKGEIDSFSYEKRYLRKDGGSVWAAVTTSWVPESDASPPLCVAVIYDITARYQALSETRRSEELHRTILDNINLGVALIDENHVILKSNKTMARIFGKEPHDFLEKKCFREFEKRDQICQHCPGQQALKDGKPHTVETEGVSDDGNRFLVKIHAAPIFDTDGKARHFIEVVEDITQKRSLESKLQQNQDRLNYLAHHDQLTGFPNRTLLYDRLHHAVERAKRHKESIAVVVFDIDRFKKVNQSLGFLFGNRVLKEIAGRLTLNLRKTDSLCRIEGNKFAMILEKAGNMQRSSNVAQKILSVLNEEPFVVDDHVLHITASVGISQYPEDGSDGETLLQTAETAMGQVKKTGGNSYQYFQPEMEKHSRYFLNLENQLRVALKSDQLTAYYQPQVDPLSGEVIGLEALARWEHPDQGLVSPGEFIPLAEETGLIVPLGQRILEEACRQGRRWQEEGLLNFRLAVNVSAIQIAKGNFVRTVKDVLKTTHLPAEHLEVEITESTLIREPALTLEALRALKRMGVSVALDDFGTGYSALSYLKTYPVDRLKIDQNFIRNVLHSTHDSAIVEAIFAMGRKLGIGVIAEGVETANHLHRVVDMGCTQVQGYYFSRPLDTDSITERLRKWLGPDGFSPLQL